MFFFKAAALASLLFSTSAHSTKKGDNVATSSVKKVGKGVSTVKKVDNVAAPRVSKKALKKQLNAQIRQKVAVTKLEKLAKLKTKASAVNLETTTFDEPAAHHKMHMRGLKMKNNFLVMTVFDDAECMTPTMQYGTLVNYCMNEEGDEGGKRSYITKLNKKENLAVDIQFDGFDCKGIPSKVSNMLYEIEDFTGWGDCVVGPENMYFTYEYLSTYPDLGTSPGMYVETTYPEDMCSTDNTNYVEFVQFPLEAFGIPFDQCLTIDGDDDYYDSFSYMYSASSCASTGQLTAYIYNDATCTDMAYPITFFENNCMADDDDDDDDYYYYYYDDDDDDYELSGVTSNEYCT